MNISFASYPEPISAHWFGIVNVCFDDYVYAPMPERREFQIPRKLSRGTKNIM